jgi:hypothetical protein
MPQETLKAYHVGEGSDGEQVVTFATSSAGISGNLVATPTLITGANPATPPA